MEMQSDQVDQLFAALAEWQIKHGVLIGKDAKAHKGKYATLESLAVWFNETAKEFHLVLNWAPDFIDGRNIIRTRLTHYTSGQFVSGKSALYEDLQAQSPDQVYGTSMSYHRRYGAMALLGLVASDDPTDNDGYRDTKPTPPVSNTWTKEHVEVVSRDLNSSPNKDNLIQMIIRDFGVSKITEIPMTDYTKLRRYIADNKG